MTRSRDERLTAEQERARAAVRALPRPAADHAFRARLAREFTTGTITSGLDHARRRQLVLLPGGAGRARSYATGWQRPLMVAAAALLVVAGAWAANRGPRWEVTAADGQGIAIVDRTPIPMNHTEQLAAAIRPGATVTVPVGSRLELTSRENLVVEITPGTEARIPATPGRWFRRSVQAELRTGELRITTGAGFRGARLDVRTPEARIEVNGTTLAIIREPHGTCVCVFEGDVQVGPLSGGMVGVDHGRRRFVFADGRAPEVDDMRPNERTELGTFQVRNAGRMGRDPAGP